jgi:hypothetical protein
VSLRRRYGSPAEARRLGAALQADQPVHLTWRVRGRVLEFDFTAPTPESARATGDDLLACLSAAERTSEISPKRRTEPARAAPADR